MSTVQSPFPLEGGRAGDGGVQATASDTPTQPSPLKGEGFDRFVRGARVSAQQVDRARSMRKAPTWSETQVWKRLRELPGRFRRQAAIGPYIVDFACQSARLVVEIDGGVHNLASVAVSDLKRDAWLSEQGYRILRVSNREVEDDLDGVIARIRTEASNRLGRTI